jgi:hypothetical protein
MISKGLNAMSAFEILAAIGTFSFGKSFKCINKSLLGRAGTQVWFNHLTQLQHPMSYASSRKPIHEPTK